jgi:hypothetical protein
MRVVLKIVVGLVALGAALFMGLMIYVRIGPTAPVPKVDPVIALNQAHADLAENAAPFYAKALDAFVDPPAKAWLAGDVNWDEETQAVGAWLEANAAIIEQTKAATERAGCWFPLRRGAGGFPDISAISNLKELMKLFRIRADFAAQRRDWDSTVESLQTIDRISRHTLQQPFVISHLIGVAGLALELDRTRHHAAAADLGLDDRAALMNRLSFAFEPPPSPSMALRTEHDTLCWQLSRESPAILVPPRRVAGEIDRYWSPYLKLAAQGPEQMLDPDHPLQIEARQVRAWTPSLSNPVRGAVHQSTLAVGRALQLHARLIAEQRGTETLARIFGYEAEHTRLPDSLPALAGDVPIDPFTGEPFIYRRTPDGFTLYSAGLDRDDDSGVHDDHFGERRTGVYGKGPSADGDYVFWPLPE